MFEKEAEEYVDLSGNRNYTERAFKDGAEFGYNKAKEEVKTAILKLRNCKNCKFGEHNGYLICAKKGIAVCSKWEMKE